MTSAALQSTLNDLAHLRIPPARISLKSDVKLGAGGYGEVYQATLDASSASPTTVAVKQLWMTQGPGVRLRVAIRLARELKVWAKLNHRNILELLGYNLSKNYGRAQLISPFMVNGNVTLYIKNKQPEISIRLKFVRDISLGMNYLHNCDPPICHGDLKPAKVLISDELDGVLCDFGLASFIQESGVSSGLTTSRTTKETARYMSPEFLLDEAKDLLKSDVWAWGCTTFEILTDCIPYSVFKKESAVVAAILKGAAPGVIDNFLSRGSDPNHSSNSNHHLALGSLQSKVPECWNFEPNERPSSSSILRVFADWEKSNPSSAFPTCAVGEVSGAGYIDDDDEDEDYDDLPSVGMCSDDDDSKHASSPYRGNSLCMNCHRYPKVRGRDFCSKPCLNAAASRLAARTQNGTSDYKFTGGAIPNFTGGGGQAPPFPGGNPGGFAPIPYQGTGYGQAYPQGWQQQQPWQQGGYGQQQPATAPAPQAPPPRPGKPCKIPGCNGTEYQPGSTYCSSKCCKAAVKQGFEIACLMCKELPKAPKRHFCGKACAEKADKNAPILLDVPKNDPKFPDIVKLFNDTWQGSNKPTVHRIIKVVNAKAVDDRFQAYRQKVEQAGHFVGQGKIAGNEKRMWHGTVRECTIGDDPNKLDMCTSTSCRLCCIIRARFDMKYVPVGVYGQGIHTSAYSSMAHGYTSVATKGSPHRVLLITRVVAGRPHIFVPGITDPNAKAPPAGYNSVAVSPKYSTSIVFQNEAICPSWLVLYS